MNRPQVFVALRGIIYATCFVSLWAWLGVSIQPVDARIPLTIPSFVRPFGAVVGLAGAMLTIWCVATFIIRGQGTPAPFDPPRLFVATGPYKAVRNPMYIGALTVILGVGLLIPSPSIVLLAVIFGLGAHLFVVLYEEPALTVRFGDSYLAYRDAVHRWLPWRFPQEKRDSRQGH